MPPPLLAKPDETYIQGKRKAKCSVAIFDVLPQEAPSEKVAEAVFKKYFRESAQSWNILEVNLTRPYEGKDLVVQEIDYTPGEDGSRVKHFLVFMKEGNRLIAAQFIPIHATQDEIISTIDKFLPTLEGAIN